MDLKKYEKIDIASQMLETALSLFIEGKDYFSALQIAGACEEIFGKYLQLNGVETSLESNAKTFISMKKNLSGIDSTVKDTINSLNKSKNSIKHMNDSSDTFVIMDPTGEAYDTLDRAIENWWKFGKSSTPLINKFLDYYDK